jgi:hypothetical protein
MRTHDQPLPGDLVIRRVPAKGLRADATYVIIHWPDTDTITAGPYQSYSYALRQARLLVRHPSERIWRDHAAPGQPEALEQVGDS